MQERQPVFNDVEREMLASLIYRSYEMGKDAGRVELEEELEALVA